MPGPRSPVKARLVFGDPLSVALSSQQVSIPRQQVSRAFYDMGPLSRFTKKPFSEVVVVFWFLFFPTFGDQQPLVLITPLFAENLGNKPDLSQIFGPFAGDATSLLLYGPLYPQCN